MLLLYRIQILCMYIPCSQVNTQHHSIILMDVVYKLQHINNLLYITTGGLCACAAGTINICIIVYNSRRDSFAPTSRFIYFFIFFIHFSIWIFTKQDFKIWMSYLSSSSGYNVSRCWSFLYILRFIYLRMYNPTDCKDPLGRWGDTATDVYLLTGY